MAPLLTWAPGLSLTTMDFADQCDFDIQRFWFIDQAKGLKVTRLLCYCSEGDNLQDAFHLAEAACKLLGLSPSNFHGMFPLTVIDSLIKVENLIISSFATWLLSNFWNSISSFLVVTCHCDALYVTVSCKECRAYLIHLRDVRTSTCSRATWSLGLLSIRSN